MSFFTAPGLSTKNAVLDFANILVKESSPGIVVLVLSATALIVLGWMSLAFYQRGRAVKALDDRLGDFSDAQEWAEETGGNKALGAVRRAWRMFLDNARVEGMPHNGIFMRPSEFFNRDELGFGVGIFKIAPGLFVSVGLACTFLGLIAALQDMATKSGINDRAMQGLLNIASAKFIMSLAGLGCSIVLTFFIRFFSVRLDGRIHALCGRIEEKCRIVSLEEIGREQLEQLREIHAHGQNLSTELAARLGEQITGTLPGVMSEAFTGAINPLLERMGQKEEAGLSSLSDALSQKLSGSVEDALTRAGEKLSAAAEQMERLLGRMDTSSSQMGTAMGEAIDRMGRAVEGLQGSMGETARTASETFNQGTEQLLGIMNRTLEGIRDNTAESTKAMSQTAQNLQAAVGAMRLEMEKTIRSGTEEARARMEDAGSNAGQSIAQAGQSVMGSFEQTGSAIARLGSELSEKAGKELLAPIMDITARLAGFVETLEAGSSAMRRSADAVNDGAKAGSAAASTFRESAQGLVEAAAPVRATTERMEGALRRMADNTRHAAETVMESSRSIAEGTSDALQSAGTILDTERRGIEASIRELSDMTKQVIGSMNELLAGMREQYGRMDDMDSKLGKAFEQYERQVKVAVNSIAQRVQQISDPLVNAVEVMRSIVDQYQNFSPRQGNR